jgi:hypothetical protein
MCQASGRRKHSSTAPASTSRELGAGSFSMSWCSSSSIGVAEHQLLRLSQGSSRSSMAAAPRGLGLPFGELPTGGPALPLVPVVRRVHSLE